LEPVFEDLREHLVEAGDRLQRVGRAGVRRVPEFLDVEPGQRVQLAPLLRLRVAAVVAGIHHRRIVPPVTTPEPERARMPSQIPLIIANEGCERFSFYGMRNVLTQYLSSTLLLYIASKTARDEAAVSVFHSFVIGVYFFPLIGGWLADRWFGKY